MPPDLGCDPVVDLPGPRRGSGQLVALVMRQHHRIHIVLLLRLVAKSIPPVVVVLVPLAEDVDGRVRGPRLEEGEEGPVADVHAGEEDAAAPGHLLGGVPGVFPAFGVELPAAGRLLPQMANQQMGHDAALGESDEHVEGPLVHDVLLQVLDSSLYIVILHACGRVELLEGVQAITLLPALLMAGVHVPVLQLRSVGNFLLHLRDCGLAFIPAPRLRPLQVRPLRRILAQRGFQLRRLKFDDRGARMPAAQREHPQLARRHVVQVSDGE
mmetsp:Transcript_58424/g.190553  ORF Transcript_58424/g.190553 Transcript_58424/m.190553 type:complete len:269 (-) Transcript_58424:1001-1807(-)